MSEVTIKLLGGIGNNLFQIACAYAYSLKHNKELILINEKFGTVHNSLDTYKENILKNIEFVEKYDISKFINYNEPTFNFNEISYIEDDVCLNGYFQSCKYFEGYEKEVIELFSYPQECADNIKEKYKDLLSQNTCSLHVRRGDFLNLPNHHPTQNMNYYMKAIKQMPKDSVFLIFSDDIKWCKENFPDMPEKFRFIEGNKDYEDLYLMSHCKNNIICNSTFSWWAAWLNNNSDKITVAPSIWFGPELSGNNTDDLYCEGWIKI